MAPGFHEPTITGMQGIGVKTPIAAVVAAATIGFASDLHTVTASLSGKIERNE